MRAFASEERCRKESARPDDARKRRKSLTVEAAQIKTALHHRKRDQFGRSARRIPEPAVARHFG